MKVTKYDVHVHDIEELDRTIIGRLFYVADDSEITITRAVGSFEEFKSYINNPKYIIHIIHIVIDEELSQREINAFVDAIKNDTDPCNFFMAIKNGGNNNE